MCRCLEIVVITEVAHGVIGLVFSAVANEVVPIKVTVTSYKLDQFAPLVSGLKHNCMAPTFVDGRKEKFTLPASI